MNARSDLPEGEVALLFVDLADAAALHAHHGARYPLIQAEHQRIVRAAAAGGVEVDNQGDSFFFAFASLRPAVAAVVAILRTCAVTRWPDDQHLTFTFGLHLGRPARTATGYVGLDVNLAARICHAGHGGQALLSAAAAERLADALPAGVTLQNLGEYRLKDIPGTTAIWQLVIAGLPAAFPPLITLPPRFSNLPAPAVDPPEATVCDLQSLFRRDDIRLLTIISGDRPLRSALAITTAGGLVEAYDALVYVDLGPITDPEAILGAIQGALTPTLSLARQREQNAPASGEDPAAPTGPRPTPSRSGDRSYGGDPLERDNPFNPLTKSVDGSVPSQPSTFSLQPSTALPPLAGHTLLVLDGFDAVLDGAVVVADLLAASPDLKVLATCVEELRLRGEYEFPLD